MRFLMPFVPVAVVTLLANSPVQAQSDGAQAPDLVGVYACEGIRPDGERYQGAVEIARHESTYQLRWTMQTGDQHLGIGIANADSLSVGYFGGLPGVVVYKIEHDGDSRRLIGTWTVIGANGRVFSETLTRVTKDLPAPVPVPTEPSDHRSIPNRGRTSVE